LRNNCHFTRHRIYLISQKWLGKKLLKKLSKSSQKSNNYEVSTAVALCFPNILGVIVLENVNLPEDTDRNRAAASVV
jgi:hypothetical protein